MINPFTVAVQQSILIVTCCIHLCLTPHGANEPLNVQLTELLALCRHRSRLQLLCCRAFHRFTVGLRSGDAA